MRKDPGPVGSQRTAWPPSGPVTVEYPAICPAELTASAPLTVPPGRVLRSTTVLPDARGMAATGCRRAARAGPAAARTTIEAAARPAGTLNFLRAALTHYPFRALQPYGERTQRYVGARVAIISAGPECWGTEGGNNILIT